jgi:hypothetical protein
MTSSAIAISVSVTLDAPPSKGATLHFINATDGAWKKYVYSVEEAKKLLIELGCLEKRVPKTFEAIEALELQHIQTAALSKLTAD